MARPRTAHVSDVKAKLVARIRDGFHRPGDPFLSNRALAERHRVSYQTAHRLLEELVQEKWIVRRPGSGTFIAGQAEPLEAVQLWFHPRARHAGSFGAGLSQRLTRALRTAGIPFVQSWAPAEARPRPRHLPVLWEARGMLRALVNERRFALVLHDAPPAGLGASYVDSVRTDDFSGGVCAAQVLIDRVGARRGLAMMAGPADDRRSVARVEGFRERAPEAAVIPAGGWYFEHGRRAAGALLAMQPTGVFCANDRLAEGFLAECAARAVVPPPVIGFDDAPIAEALHLSTIAIPWEQLVTEAVGIIRRRLEGDVSPARQIILSLRPHIRLTA